MKNIEVTMQLSSGNITVEIEVPTNASENDIHNAAVVENAEPEVELQEDIMIGHYLILKKMIFHQEQEDISNLL